MNLSQYQPSERKRLFEHLREEVGAPESNYINVCHKCKRGFKAKTKGERICPKCETKGEV